jgi:hypothetical protein
MAEGEIRAAESQCGLIGGSRRTAGGQYARSRCTDQKIAPLHQRPPCGENCIMSAVGMFKTVALA